MSKASGESVYTNWAHDRMEDAFLIVQKTRWQRVEGSRPESES